MATLLEQLRSMSSVIVDAGDINAIATFKPQEATLTASLISAAIQMPQYQSMVDEALQKARSSKISAMDYLFLAFGLEILKLTNGRLSLELDARFADNTAELITRAQKMARQFYAQDCASHRLLIKMPATWEGISAGQALEQEGIHCNITLVFGLHQAIACAVAGVTLISPLVGRILDWHKRHSGKEKYADKDDPGVMTITSFYNYYKKFNHKTQIIAGGFRNQGQITALSGCDILSISPGLLSDLHCQHGSLTRQLEPIKSQHSSLERIAIDSSIFQRLHRADAMTSEKLEEGVKGLSRSFASLENQINQRLAQWESGSALSHVADDLFMAYDMDSDGFITREEWAGTDAVFDALDGDKDGKITTREIAIGLGILH